MYLSKLLERTAQRVNPNVNYEIWMIMICQCRFIDCSQRAPLVGDVHDAGDHVCIGAGGMRELSILSAQCCCETKTALKILSIKKWIQDLWEKQSFIYSQIILPHKKSFCLFNWGFEVKANLKQHSLFVYFGVTSSSTPI